MAHAIESVELDAGGGATLLKALMLADLIVERPVLRAVEIGVYRGRLLLPLALVMKWRGTGDVFGIDPYSVTSARQCDEHEVGIDLRNWPDTVDWDGLYDEVSRSISLLHLGSYCHLVRARSADAAQQFPLGSIDLLHIDGNHDRAEVAHDAELYLPRVSAGGYVVLDDPSWSSVRPVMEALSAHHELLFRLFDGKGIATDGVGGNDFALFRLCQDSTNGAESSGL
jgi:hypothetical protein